MSKLYVPQWLVACESLSSTKDQQLSGREVQYVGFRKGAAVWYAI